MARVTGGERYDAALVEAAARLEKLGVLAVGFLEGATYPDGTPVASVAAIQNFGAPAAGIPPRPFFSNMVRAKSPGWGKSLAAILKENGGDVRAGMQLLGKGIEGQLVQAIRDTNAPPLADATIARKGFDKPLIDTGNMWRSVDSEIVE